MFLSNQTCLTFLNDHFSRCFFHVRKYWIAGYLLQVRGGPLCWRMSLPTAFPLDVGTVFTVGFVSCSWPLSSGEGSQCMAFVLSTSRQEPFDWLGVRFLFLLRPVDSSMFSLTIPYKTRAIRDKYSEAVHVWSGLDAHAQKTKFPWSVAQPY